MSLYIYKKTTRKLHHDLFIIFKKNSIIRFKYAHLSLKNNEKHINMHIYISQELHVFIYHKIVNKSYNKSY